MKRGGYIQRRTPMRRKGKSKYATRARDTARMAWVRSQPCVLVTLGGCKGETQAHHAGRHGMGRKAPDDTCIPICDGHHDAWHDGGVPFTGMDKERRRYWAETQIDVTRMRYEAETGGGA